jgi:uncharacterized protein with FMN-binding domain
MGIKRPLIIAGSTVSAVAAVLSYHPAASGIAAPVTQTPELPIDTATPATTPEPSAPATPAPATPATPAPAPTPDLTASATPTATALPTPKATAKKKSSSTKKSPTSTTTSDSANITPDPTPSTSTPTTVDSTPAPKAAKDQTVTGATAQTRWGPVQVQITVKDGKIVDAVGLQYPNGDRRSQWISDQAIPWLVEETLAEQIANVQIIGGATYTSMGWRQSLASAMQKAGL